MKALRDEAEITPQLGDGVRAAPRQHRRALAASRSSRHRPPAPAPTPALPCPARSRSRSRSRCCAAWGAPAREMRPRWAPGRSCCPCRCRCRCCRRAPRLAQVSGCRHRWVSAGRPGGSASRDSLSPGATLSSRASGARGFGWVFL